MRIGDVFMILAPGLLYAGLMLVGAVRPASASLDATVDDAGRIVNILRHDRKVQGADCPDCYSAAYGDTADEGRDDAKPEKGAFSP